MGKKIDISVIIAVYNEEKNLKGLLDSLMDQKFEGTYEIILVDDYSTDRTYEIAKEYPIIVIKNDRNIGRPGSLNKGVKKSRGKIITFIDGDCRVKNDWLNTILKTFNKNSEIDAVMGILSPYYKDIISRSLAILNMPAPSQGKRGFVNRVSGVHSIIREKFFEVGCWEENTIYGGADIFFSEKLRKKKIRMYFNPEINVYHKHRQTLKEIFIWVYKATKGSWWLNKKPRYWKRLVKKAIPTLFLLLTIVTSFSLALFMNNIFFLLILLIIFIPSIIKLRNNYMNFKTFFLFPVILYLISLSMTLRNIMNILKIQ